MGHQDDRPALDGPLLGETQIRAPIIVVEGGDVEAYSTLQDAELDLEVTDVKAGIFAAYDSEGRKLSVGVGRGPRRSFLDRVFKRAGVLGRHEVPKISAVEVRPSHADELASIIRQYLRAASNLDVESMALPELVSTLAKFQGRT